MPEDTDEIPKERPVPRQRNFFEFLFIKFNTIYENFFSLMGQHIGAKPYHFILISLILTGICSLGFLRANMLQNAEDLFIPIDCKSVKDRDIIADLLPMNYDDYFIHQDYDLGIFGDVIFVAKDYGNIGRSAVRDEIKRINNLIQKINVTYDNHTYFYGDLCVKRNNRCIIDGDVFFRETFWQRLKTKQLDKYLLNDFYTDDDDTTDLLKFVFGKNYKLNMQEGKLSAKVLKLHFNLQRAKKTNNKIKDIEIISRMWEQAFLEFFQHFQSIIVKPFYAVSTSIDQELNKNINLDIMWVVLTFVVMIIVSTICLSLRGPFAQTPVYLSVIGVLATMFGLLTGFGFCALIGVPMCPLIFVTPFLVIGVGTDDMFLIYSAYHRTKSSDSTAQRLADTFRYCGSGITITTLTNIIAFLAGATTNFYGIRLFCFYTSASLLFCYFYQVMLFGGSVALYNECIRNNRHTLFPCYINNSSSKANSKHRHHHRQQCLPWKEMFVCIIKPLFTRSGQIIVILIFIIYTIITFYGASQTKDGMRLGQLLNDDSYAKHYFDTLDKEYELYPLIQFVVTEPIPYWRHDYLKRLRTLVTQAKQLKGMDPQIEISWFSLINYNAEDYPLDNGTMFMEIVHGFVNLFPVFYGDLVMNNTHLITSRFYLKFGIVHYNSSDGFLINQLRSLVEQSKLPIKIYCSLFKYYEQMYEVVPNIIQTFLIAIEAMYIATLLIIPDLKSVLIIITTMLLILVSLVATLHIWSINISAIMMVELVMSIGFCSDFCVHIVHAFLTGTGTRKERAQQALINMGMPIFCASLSSIIGVLFLSFTKSYLFHTFFVTILSIMILGCIHALCFLPVILSLIGSHWPSHTNNNNNNVQENNSIPMTSKFNHDSQIDEYKIKKNQLQTRTDTIEEEDNHDLLPSTIKNDQISMNT